MAMLLIIAIILLAAAQASDYFYQADLHGWKNPLWINGTRAPKWGIIDFIPHDGWHIAQTLRNFGDCVGMALAAIWLLSILPSSRINLFDPEYIMICLAVSLALRALLRGMFFSLPYKILNRR